MEPRSAWVLNLDADLELEAGLGYQPTARVLAAMRPHAAILARALLSAGDVIVDEYLAPGALREASPPYVGRAFMPTPTALARLVAVGAEPVPAPSFEVLRRVNSRAFAAALGETLSPSAFITRKEVALAFMTQDPGESGAWRLKRAFGMAGRGQRRVPRGPLGKDDLSFLLRAIDSGGLVIEPEVEIEAELAMHGFVRPNGALLVGEPCIQRCDARGQWIETTPLGPDTPFPTEVERLREEVSSVATALSSAGYFGPFGVDAFVYRRGGTRALQPRSEINARYSMGFAAGFDRCPHLGVDGRPRI